MKKEIFSVIFLADGQLVRMESTEERSIANRIALEWAREEIPYFAEYLQNKDESELSDYELLECFSEKFDAKEEVFVQKNTLSSLDTEKYPYCYMGEYLTLKELQQELIRKGNHRFSGMFPEDFEKEIRRRREKEPLFLESLSMRYYCIYRRGEKKKVVYALNNHSASVAVCSSVEHPEFWVVSSVKQW